MLSGTLPALDIEAFYGKAVQGAVKEVSLPGFRRGHVPEARVIEEVGSDFLWKDAAERALKEKLTDILTQEAVAPIAPVSILLTSVIKKGADVGFEITVITPPTVSIAHYKDTAKNALDTLPQQDKEKELGDARRAFRTQVRAVNATKNPADVKETNVSRQSEAEADEPLSDEEAKRVGLENGKAAEHFILGEAEKAVADRIQQKKRGAVAEALIGASTYDIPNMLVDDEIRALLETFKQEVKAQGMEWNDYLGRVKKTEEEVKKDLTPNAEKRIALDLVFGHIIREEKLEISEEDKKKEEEFAHKLAEQGVPHDRAHQYAREQFMREKVWAVLGVN